jgi:hypothetical protein
MNAAAKLVMGLLVTIAGLAWYIWGDTTFKPYLGVSSVTALEIIFVGSFGLFLIMVGLFVTWIEIEDIKDMKAEKSAARKAETEEREIKPAKKKR